MLEHITHTLPPVFDANSRVLILGTMPSPKSREQGFYYGHPQNRFWQVLAQLWGEPLPLTPKDRLEFVLRHHLALWDVLASCFIDGALDSTIRQPEANDIPWILSQAPIRHICTTGGKAAQLYKRYCLPQTGLPALELPSTSPANCRTKLPQLVEAYRPIKQLAESPYENLTKSSQSL
ncbi:MAG: DNA-deoxyinosine glycosylase [Eubacteriales bacterium]|jgi:TDG/mug DNA glycosylase family protein